MAKKDFKEKISKLNLDVTDPAKDLFSQQTKGEKRKYTKLQHKENKSKIVTVLLTETEYNQLLTKAEEENSKSISEYIRAAINEKMRG